MSAVDPLDNEDWHRYIRGEYVPDRLPPEAEPTDGQPGGARLRAATDVCLRCHRAISPAQGREYTQFTDRRRRQAGRFAIGKIVRPIEAAALEAWAADGYLLDAAEFTSRWVEQGRLGGAEHEIFFDPTTQRWHKRNNLAYHSNYLEYFHRLALHNELFPEAPVCLEGFVDCAGILMPVLSQPHVRADRGASRVVTEAELYLFGFERMQEDNYYQRALGVLAEDLHDENVVIGEDGALYVIDPALYLDERGKGLRLRQRLEDQR